MKHGTTLALLALILYLAGNHARRAALDHDAARASLERATAGLREVHEEVAAAAAGLHARRSATAVEQDFRNQWRAAHTERHGSAQEEVAALAESLGLTVLERRRESLQLAAHGGSSPALRHSFRVVGPYAPMLELVGRVEARLDLACLQQLTLGRALNDAALGLTLVIPEPQP